VRCAFFHTSSSLSSALVEVKRGLTNFLSTSSIARVEGAAGAAKTTAARVTVRHTFITFTLSIDTTSTNFVLFLFKRSKFAFFGGNEIEF
jgi:hypothetical protein